MTVELIDSPSLINLDSTPSIRNTAGQGGAGHLSQVNDFVTTTTGKTSPSIYRIVRIRSNATVKTVLFESAAMGTSTTMNVGLYYSDDPLDQSYAVHAGAAVDMDFFATLIDNSSAVGITDVTNESGTYTLAKRNQPIWQAAGLSADPECFFDVACTSGATINTGAAMGLDVRFVNPGD